MLSVSLKLCTVTLASPCVHTIQSYVCVFLHGSLCFNLRLCMCLEKMIILIKQPNFYKDIAKNNPFQMSFVLWLRTKKVASVTQYRG